MFSLFEYCLTCHYYWFDVRVCCYLEYVFICWFEIIVYYIIAFVWLAALSFSLNSHVEETPGRPSSLPTAIPRKPYRDAVELLFRRGFGIFWGGLFVRLLGLEFEFPSHVDTYIDTHVVSEEYISIWYSRYNNIYIFFIYMHMYVIVYTLCFGESAYVSNIFFFGGV